MTTAIMMFRFLLSSIFSLLQVAKYMAIKQCNRVDLSPGLEQPRDKVSTLLQTRQASSPSLIELFEKLRVRVLL